jgi:hypothetical protein
MAWHQITVTVNRSGYMKMYIDGKYETQLDISAYPNVSVTNGKNVLIGYNDSSSEYFPGSIDDVRIYNRSLSVTEVTGLYDQYNPKMQISNLQKGLVGWWKMNGNARDSGGYGNNGTAVSVTLTTDRKGQANKAYSFTGSSTINAGNSPSLNITGDVSISFWIKTTLNNSSWLALIEKEDGCSSNNRGYSVYLYTGRMFFTTYNCGGLTGSFIADGNWHHIVGVLSSGMYYLYLDGNPDGSQAAAGNPSIVAGSLGIGNYSVSATLDDVRVYNRALSAAEAKALYDEYDPGTVVSNLQKGVVGQWKMDGNGKDISPYQNNGTVVGAIPAADHKGQANKAYYFSGTNNYVLVNNSASQNNLSQLTVETWINPDSGYGQTAPRVWAKGNAFRGWINSSNGIFIADIHDNSGDYAGPVASTIPIPTGTWTHLVVVLDATPKLNLYINGVLNATGATLTSPTIQANDLYFGNVSPSGTRQYTGFIDGIRMWNRPLSAAEVKSLYDSY